MSDQTARNELELRDAVLRQVRLWHAELNLEHLLVDKFVHVFPWLYTSSPQDASLECYALAAMELHLWFIYIDDYRGPDFEAHYALLDRALDARPPAEPIAQLYSEQALRMGRYGFPMARYANERRTALSALVQRNRLLQSNEHPSFVEFATIRDITIYYRIWFTAWEILAGFFLPAGEYDGPAFSATLDRMCRWQVLINDLHSLRRDARDGMPNLVYCVQREKQCQLHEAIAWVEGEMSRLETEIIRDHDQALLVDAAARDWRLIRSFEFLRASLDGSRQLYNRRSTRYEQPERAPAPA